jgi:hypothetical protein
MLGVGNLKTKKNMCRIWGLYRGVPPRRRRKSHCFADMSHLQRKRVAAFVFYDRHRRRLWFEQNISSGSLSVQFGTPVCCAALSVMIARRAAWHSSPIYSVTRENHATVGGFPKYKQCPGCALAGFPYRALSRTRQRYHYFPARRLGRFPGRALHLEALLSQYATAAGIMSPSIDKIEIFYLSLGNSPPARRFLQPKQPSGLPWQPTQRNYRPTDGLAIRNTGRHIDAHETARRD